MVGTVLAEGGGGAGGGPAGMHVARKATDEAVSVHGTPGTAFLSSPEVQAQRSAGGGGDGGDGGDGGAGSAVGASILFLA